MTTKIKLCGSMLVICLLSACGDPNHYDSHKGQEPDPAHESSAHDTIQGRAPDSTVVVTESTNIGIGDTTLNRTH